MKNKKEFLYILTLCIVVAAVFFGFTKSFSNISSAANLNKLKIAENNGDLDSDLGLDSDINFNSNLEIPSLMLNSSDEAEESDAGSSADSPDVLDDLDLLSVPLQEENFLMEGNNEEEIGGEKSISAQEEQNAESIKEENDGKKPAKEKQKIIATMPISDYEERNQFENKEKISEKDFSEKGTIFSTHKNIENKESKNSLKLGVSDSKIVISEGVQSSQMASWIEVETDNKDEKKPLVKSLAEPSGVLVKEISIFNKKDFSDLKVSKSSNALFFDSDNDGISDDTEKIIGSDPNKADSNSDGFLDGVELSLGYNPAGKGVLSKSDLSLLNAPRLEDKEGNPVMVDSDKDGVSDKQELIFGTDPFNSDSDSDGFSDGEEIAKGFNPLISAAEKDDKIKLESPASSYAPISKELSVAVVVKSEESWIIEGMGEPNSFLAVYIFSDPITVLVKTNSAGKWAYTLKKALDYGEHTVYTAIIDASGAIVSKSNPAKFLLEEIKAPDVNLAGAAAVSVESAEANLAPWNKDPKTVVFLAAGAIMLIAIGGYAIKEMKG